MSFKIRALDRFILNELKSPFLFGLVAFTTILVAGGLLFQMANLIIEKGVSVGVVIRLFIYYVPRLVVLTIPMSCLLSALLGFGKLSSNSEIVALKSAGLSFQRIARPVAVAAFFISVITFVINESVVPISERAASNVMKYEVLHESAPLFSKKIFLKEEEEGSVKRVIYIDQLDNRTKEMTGITVEEFENDLMARIVFASKGKWEKGSWWLYDGAVYEIDGTTKKIDLLFKFNRQALILSLGPSEITMSGGSPDEMTISELLSAIDLKEKMGEGTTALWMALHLRLAVPWACLIFGVLGAALGSRPQRSSSSVGFGLSVIIIFAYYVIMSFSRALGDSGKIPAVLAAWMANAVFLAVSARMCVRANKLG
ncbi:MAG: LptF/LptG family permease [Synergistes sp.]|nr:LptF/LptG family permease [Synergistes sp.]